jgi:hypothetical protein
MAALQKNEFAQEKASLATPSVIAEEFTRVDGKLPNGQELGA